MRIIVIGSGAAGLTAAAYAARAGHEVTVLEQFGTIGGVTATVRQDGFAWDLGPLLLEGFGPDDDGTQVLRELEATDGVRFARDDRGIAFPDFSLWKPAEYRGPSWRREQLAELFPDDADGLARYEQFANTMLDLRALARRAARAAPVAAGLLRLRMALRFLRVKRFADRSAAEVMAAFFTRPELRALYTAILADFVVLPSEFPGLGIPLVNVETAFDRRIPLDAGRAGPWPGYCYALGGVGTIVDALARATTAAGGNLLTNAAVVRIEVEGGTARGVRLADGRLLPADLVVASGGARETLFGLVGRQHLGSAYAAGIDGLVPMESVLMVHLGVAMDPRSRQPAALAYYYRTYDVEGSVLRCRRGDFHEGRDGFLIYVPSLHSPEMAPAGHHAITVYTIAPNRLDRGSWAERRDELAEKLIEEAERVLPGLRRHERTRLVLTPEDFRARIRVEHHSFGGTAPVMGKRNPAHETPVRGLWFIGAQSESSGGVAGVMAGARKVMRRLLAYRPAR